MEISNVATITMMTVTEELLFIKEQNGGMLDPVDVVEFARDPDTSLHSKFEWDDTKAAEQHRLWQARQIISLELVVVGEGDEQRTVRAFVSLTQDRRTGDTRGYRDLLEVLSDEELTRKLLAEAKRDMQRFRQKYSSLTALAKVFAVMDEVE